MRTHLLKVILAALVLSLPGLAQAEPSAFGDGSITDSSVHHRQSDLSLLAWLPWYYGFGFGAQVRFEIPIVPDGFIPSINDEFSIEPSFGLAYSSYGVYGGYNYGITDVTPAIYGIWSFWFSRAFRAYGGLGLGYNVGIYANNNAYGNIGASFFYWDPCVGLHYKLSDNIGLRAEAGAQGLKGGLAIYF